MTREPGWTWPRLHHGQRLILHDMLVHGSRSRAELARRAGLSRTSLTRLTRDLVSFGLVAEGGTAVLAGRGRPAEMLHVVPGAAHLIGVKLTGGDLYAVAIDLHARPVARREERLGSREVDDVVRQVADVVTSLRTEVSRVAAIGLCLAGDVRIDPDGRASVVGSSFLGWQDVPLQARLEPATGLPVAVSNDVQALTVGHHWFGRGVGRDSIAVVGYGEGIGAGLIIDGDLVQGAHGHPGKIGHLHVERSEARCALGHRGCVSALAPVPRLLELAGAADIDEVVAGSARGEQRHLAALDGAVRALATVVAHLVNLVDPEVVLVTGEGIDVARARAGLLTEAVRERLDPAAELGALELVDFRFEDYARSAAVRALQRLLV